MRLRRWLGLLLVLAASFALWPFLQQAVAYSQGSVGFPGTTAYTVVPSASSTSALISCSVPSQISLKGNKTVTNTFIQCRNNFARSVTLTWQSYGTNASWVAASNSATLPADGLVHCTSVTLTSTSNGNKTVTLKGATASTADFYVEIYFNASISVAGNGTGTGGCP